MIDKIEIFFCYAPEDEELRKGLEKQLKALKRQGIINTWYDRDINAGTEWEREMDKHLNSAQIILLLVSPDFMDSDYCYSKEMIRAIKRHECAEARVIPIILRPVYWQEAPFGKLQPLPMNGKPVTTWSNRDAAFLSIVQDIRKVVEELITTSSIDFEIFRDAYSQYLIDKYQRLDFTALPISSFDLNTKQFEPLFVMPQLKWREQENAQDTVLIADVLEQTQCSVLLGDLGSGKTALLRYLALVFAKGEGEDKLGITTRFLPLLIPLQDYLSKQALSKEKVKLSFNSEEADYPFFNYLYMRFAKVRPHLPEGFFEYYLERGEGLVLFDGLDEVLKFSDKNEVRELIWDFVASAKKKHPNNRIVITARFPDHDAPLDDVRLYMDRFDCFDLSPFTQPQIDQFVRAWYGQSSQEIRDKVQNLLSTLKNPRALSLATNPLYLTIIALIHSYRGVLPNRRVDLYDQVTEAVLMRDKWKELSDEPNELDEYKRMLLEHIAFWMQSQPEESTRDELHRKLIPLLKKEGFSIKEARIMATNFINWSVKRGSLLTIENEIYRFKHPTFQAYFAAHHVHRNYIEAGKRIRVIENVVMTHLYDPAWGQMILFLVSLLRRNHAPQIVYRVLKETEYRFLYPRELLMALRFLAEDVRVSSTLQDEILTDIWQKCFGESPEVSWRSGQWRKFCRDVLSILPEIRGSSCEEKVLDKLLNTLHDARPAIRVLAVEGLGQVGYSGERVISALIRVLDDKDQNPSVQNAARQALTKLGQDHEEVVAKLEQITADENQNLSLRKHAARALMHLSRNHPLTLEVVLLKQSRPSDTHIVREWVQCSLEGKKTIELQAWEKLVEPLELVLLQALTKTSTLEEATADLVRSQAAWIVGRLKCSSFRLVEALLTASKDDNPLVRENVCWALGMLGPHDSAVGAVLATVKEILKERLQDEDRRTREAADKALKKLEE